MTALSRRLAAEGFGTTLLLTVVIGSGIMGERLAGGNVAIALLANTLATGAGLVVLITIFGPISGAHFNPAVSMVAALRQELSLLEAAAYVAVQFTGAISGAWLAHAMFGEAVFQVSSKLRDGLPLMLSELVATFGLVLTILATIRLKPSFTPAAVGLYIASAYWFTASTSFANPAAAVGRTFSNTFAGISPGSLPGFIGAEIAGALAALVFAQWLLRGTAEAVAD